MVELNSSIFQRRVQKLTGRLVDDLTAEWNDVDCILLAIGSNDEEASSYQKSTALETWLLGYEFPDTLTLITPKKVVFLTSSKKGSYLEPLNTGPVSVEVLKRTKDEEHNKKLFEQFVDEITKSKNGKRIGNFPKDRFVGSFIKSWNEVLKTTTQKHNFELVDVSAPVATILAIKDQDDMKSIQVASKVSSVLMQNWVPDHVLAILDDGKTFSHEKISDLLERSIDSDKIQKKYKFPEGIDFDLIDTAYSPIIQSGGKFDLRPSAQSTSDALTAGPIICSLGLRYRGYCSNVARTFFIDPEKSVEANYKFLLQLQAHLIKTLEEGVGKITGAEFYDAAVKYIKDNKPELVGHLPKSLGSSIGLEFREHTFVLSSKCTRVLEPGMVLNLTLGLQNLENNETKDKKRKEYAMMISDTLHLTSSGVNVLTDSSKELKEISYMFRDDEEEESKKPKKAIPENSRILKTKTRGEGRGDEVTDRQRRLEHQAQLAEQKQKEGLERFAEGEKVVGAEKTLKMKKYESYKKESQLPREVKDLRVYVDKRNESIILPIYGLAVPFHVSTLKNVSKSDEGEFVYLRFNFLSPGQSVGQKGVTASYEDPNATFIRSISFKSSDTYRFNEIYKEINDLKKALTKREEERREMADLVEQARLVETRGRPMRLSDVFSRPQLDKRVPGDLEIHTNGIRYQSSTKSDQRIDILFSNIKHLFFQPCESELLVLIHVHLKNPIMIGKKKTTDIQFFREVSDATFDETGNRRRRYNYGDDDELMAEQEERKRRYKLNQEFKNFANAIAEAGSEEKLQVDIPHRALGFDGVPYRQLCLLQPTSDCLVHLSEPPFLVITWNDVELVHLERVSHGLKNFDMVIVFKDFSKQPVHINSIPKQYFTAVEELLDSLDVLFYEGPVNLNWKEIMKTVNEDPAAFFQEGGWSFLKIDSDNEDASEDEESEYEASEPEDYEESESDFSEGGDSDSGSESGSESGSASGSDFDESDESEDERPKKSDKGDKKRKASNDRDSSKKKVKR